MAVDDAVPIATATTTDDSGLADDPADPSRPHLRPYLRPVLRHLGSVRELTLGGTRGKAEGAGTLLPVM